MKVGDLVRISAATADSQFGLRRRGLQGVIIRDIEPGRGFSSMSVFDVMWDNGTIEDLCCGDLELINESR